MQKLKCSSFQSLEMLKCQVLIRELPTFECEIPNDKIYYLYIFSFIPKEGNFRLLSSYFPI